MDIKIAIAYHKPSVLLQEKYFLPIHVGKALSNQDLHIQGDDEGDNISSKNPLYCELTGLYWLWKNTSADYKGLMHYRRIFTERNSFSFFINSQDDELTRFCLLGNERSLDFHLCNSGIQGFSAYDFIHIKSVLSMFSIHLAVHNRYMKCIINNNTIIRLFIYVYFHIINAFFVEFEI